MGDRSNIAIKDDYTDSRVYLYAHWGGEYVLHSLIHGFKSGREDDPAYLARIVFQHMTKDDLEGTTGYGISTSIQDNEHAILVVDNAHVRFEDESGGALTVDVSAAAFVGLVESIANLDDLMNEGRAYEVLIHKMGAK